LHDKIILMPEESPEQGILRIVEPTRQTVMLDDVRETFSRMIAAGEGIEKSYNTAYGVTLSAYDANNMAMTLLSNKYVVDRINQLYKERMIMRNLTKESVVVKLAEMFDVSLVDYFKSDMSGLKDTSEWSEPMRLSAKKIEFGKFGVKFEIADKLAIADKMISMLGYINPEQKEITDSGLSKYTDKELAEMAGVEVDYQEVKQSKKK